MAKTDIEIARESKMEPIADIGAKHGISAERVRQLEREALQKLRRFADPDLGLSFGYAMTKMGPGLLLNPRGQSLADAARACAAAA